VSGAGREGEGEIERGWEGKGKASRWLDEERGGRETKGGRKCRGLDDKRGGRETKGGRKCDRGVCNGDVCGYVLHSTSLCCNVLCFFSVLYTVTVLYCTVRAVLS
jgi:hypothetical protein